MEAGRGFLWLPVCFGIGILFYFALPEEPSAIAVTGLARRARSCRLGWSATGLRGSAHLSHSQRSRRG